MSRAVNNSFGSYLRDLRNSKNLSLKDLQELSGISASYLNRLENCGRRSPSFGILEKLAGCLGVETLQLCQVAMNNKDGDFDEQLFETVIYNNNFVIGDLEADTSLKECIVSLIKCVIAVEWSVATKYQELSQILSEVDKFKKCLE